MPLVEYLRRVTHREHLTWLAYLDEEHNPDLLHWYLMRVAQRVEQVLAKNPGAFTLLGERVEFEKQEEPVEETVEEATAREKAQWRGHLLGRKD